MDAKKQAVMVGSVILILGLVYGVVDFILPIFGSAVGGTGADSINSLLTAFNSPTVFTIVGAVIILMIASLVVPAIKPFWDLITGMGSGSKKGKSYD